MNTSIFPLVGGVLSFFNLAYLAYKIWTGKTPAQNTTSWLFWFILDSIVLSVTIISHQPIWLALSYVIGAGLVTISHIKMGSWGWTRREVLSLIMTVIAAAIWLFYRKDNPEIATFGAVGAMTCAGIPLLIDFSKAPVYSTWPVWGITVIACIFSSLGSDWSITGQTLSIGGVLYNGTLFFFALRGK